MEEEKCPQCGGEMYLSVNGLYKQCTECGNIEMEEHASIDDVF